MSNYDTVAGHRHMAGDARRNAAYSRAMSTLITPDTVVLDVGACTGVLGLEAARLGARRVYLVDSSPVVHLAADVAKANKLEDRVEIIHAPLEELRLNETVDLIVSVFTGNFLLEEDLLPTLFTARDRFLGEGGKMLPDRAVMEVAPVSLPDYYAAHLEAWETLGGSLDFGAACRYVANSPCYDSANNFSATLLGPAVELHQLDLSLAQTANCRSTVTLNIEETASCHGFMGWFRMRLGDEWLSTSPKAEATHWSQVFFPLEKPVEVREGETVTLTVVRPEYGDWSWHWQSQGADERHSSFLSTPADLQRMKRSANDYRPRMNSRGQAMRAALAAIESGERLADLEQQFVADFREELGSEERARRFLRAAVRAYG